MLRVIYKVGICYIVLNMALLKFPDGMPAPLNSDENPTQFDQTLADPDPAKVEERRNNPYEVTEMMGWNTWKIIDPLENGFLNEQEFQGGNMHFIGKRVLPYSKDRTYA